MTNRNPIFLDVAILASLLFSACGPASINVNVPAVDATIQIGPGATPTPQTPDDTTTTAAPPLLFYGLLVVAGVALLIALLRKP